MRKTGLLGGLAALGIVGAAGLLQAQQPAKSDELGGKDRFLTAVSTDKPIYKTGETVFVRGVLLHAFDHTPLAEQANATIQIQGPKGDVVAPGNTFTQDSVWSFTWQVPEGQPGGEYTLKVLYPWQGHAPAERKFDVRVYRAPRLKSQIVFIRDGYGPGDKVGATLDVKRAEGGVPAGAKVTATARVDGAEVARVVSAVDAVGRCTVSFDLPKQIEKGEGSLAFAIEDGGVIETATKTIPILLQTLDIALYPEGGELVAGVSNRIYFQARTPAQKPADIVGDIVRIGSTGSLATVRSEHEGRGRFVFTPEPGAKYELRVREPSGIKTAWPLPIATGTVAMRTELDVVGPTQAVPLSLFAGADQRVRVTLSARERELSTVTMSLRAGGQAALNLDARDAEGVLTATVFDDKGAPLAERLVFRKPAKQLAIELIPDRKSYVPGGQAQLTVKTTRDGKPVSAVVGLTVTDDSVLEMIEKREQAFPKSRSVDEDARLGVLANWKGRPA